MTRNPKVQAGITSVSRYYNKGIRYDANPEPHQMWMCPQCDHMHHNCPITMNIYRCKECDWVGNRSVLLRAVKKDPQYMYDVEITHVDHT